MAELLSVRQMAQADGLAMAEGTAGIELMENAGAAVAAAAAQFAEPGRRILVACGPGNNGGDGFVAARLLRQSGHRVTACLLGEVGRVRGDAALALAALGEAPAAADAVDPSRFGLIVDSLFGAGLTRDLDGEAARLVAAINDARVPVVAVDLPSGIDGDSGRIRGVAARASHTVTFFRKKPGHLLYPGRAHCGRVTVADIGIRDDVLGRIGPDTCENLPELWCEAFPCPAADGHKYDRGHALAVSGGRFATGACRMAARAALRIGAGLVTIAGPSEALAVHAAHVTAVMLRECADARGLAKILADRRFRAIVLGPGLGVSEETCSMAEAALASEAGAVLDADALTSFAGKASSLFHRISERQAPVVLTPHSGELARLFGSDLAGRDRLGAARQAAAESGAVVVAKGADTVIAAPNGYAAINTNASAFLATAGAGDVLAGMICGLLAQQMPAFEAACAAVWLHGEAARRFGAGLIAEDLAEQLPELLQKQFAG